MDELKYCIELNHIEMGSGIADQGTGTRLGHRCLAEWLAFEHSLASTPQS